MCYICKLLAKTLWHSKKTNSDGDKSYVGQDWGNVEYRSKESNVGVEEEVGAVR